MRKNRFSLVAILALLSVFASQPALASQFEVHDSVLLIPSGIKKIPAKAFADRTDFNHVEFQTPCSLAEIGEYAFLGCTALRSLTLPSSVKTIGQGAFRECSALKEAVLPRSLTKLPRYAFAWCSSLESVQGATAITDIAAHAFAYCASLKSFYFPSTLLHIGSNAFSFCGSLTEIALPASITELESYAFSECVSLKKATLPANSHLLGELIFSGCRALEEITELSPTPPKFDCESTLFEPTEAYLYTRCRLLVPASSLPLYRRSPSFRLFSHISTK